MENIWNFLKKLESSRIFWLLVIAGVALGVLISFARSFAPEKADPIFRSRLIWTEGEQGWIEPQRLAYYQTTQGTLVIPYSWFLSIENPGSDAQNPELFSSAPNQSRYGLLPDDPLSPYNPDGLPIGIVRDVVEDRHIETLGQGIRNWASISCAACHTGEIHYRGLAIRIDGAGAMWDFSQWSSDLVFGLFYNAALPSVFERFSARVLEVEKRLDPERYGPMTLEQFQGQLREQIAVYYRSQLISDAFDALFNRVYPETEGFARTDALGRGVNGEFSQLSLQNVKRGEGAVSYPPLWYTHDFDWVQSVAAIRQPLGRNITEAWGVSVRVALTEDRQARYASTAAIREMVWMENLLSVLQPPRWPENVFGGVDPEKLERGRYLYEEAVFADARPPREAELPADAEQLIGGPNPDRPRAGYCARCHGPALETEPNRFGKRYIQLPLYRLDVMGTDPNDAVAFNARQVVTGRIRDDFDNQPVVGVGAALTTTITGIKDRWFDDHQVPLEERPSWEGYRDNLFRAPLGYPARPMAGYWATGPFLHNGSVPNLYELLSPVEERSKKFYVGSREFDPVKIGYRADNCRGCFLFDVSRSGNSNAGHEFREAPANTAGVIGPFLSEDDRYAIIEYMKVIDDVADLRAREDNRGYYRDEYCQIYERLWDWASIYEGQPATAASYAGYGTRYDCSHIQEALEALQQDR